MGPKFAPSHDSPASMTPLPHFWRAMQEEVSSSHDDVQERFPEAKVELKERQELTFPKVLPSHISPASSTPSPQVDCLLQEEVSILQLEHLSSPGAKTGYWLQFFSDPKDVPSHSSPAALTLRSPHLGADWQSVASMVTPSLCMGLLSKSA